MRAFLFVLSSDSRKLHATFGKKMKLLRSTVCNDWWTGDGCDSRSFLLTRSITALQTVNCRYGLRRDADISSIPQKPLCSTRQPFESIFSKLENIVFLLRRLSVAVDIFSLRICRDLREFIHVWCIQNLKQRRMRHNLVICETDYVTSGMVYAYTAYLHFPYQYKYKVSIPWIKYIHKWSGHEKSSGGRARTRYVLIFRKSAFLERIFICFIFFLLKSIIFWERYAAAVVAPCSLPYPNHTLAQ